MSTAPVPFNRGVVSPVACITEAKDMLGDQYWMLLGITFLGMMIGQLVPMGLLMGPMMCGIYIAYLERIRGGRAEFDHLFKGFDFFGQSFIATLVIVGITLLILLPFYCVMFGGMAIAGANDSPEGMMVVMAISMVVYVFMFIAIMLVSLLLIFTFPLIADKRLSAMTALKTSCKAAWANLGGLIGLMFLATLISMAGTLLCIVGVIFTYPLLFGAMAVAYRKVFPDDEFSSKPQQPGDTQFGQPNAELPPIDPNPYSSPHGG